MTDETPNQTPEEAVPETPPEPDVKAEADVQPEAEAKTEEQPKKASTRSRSKTTAKKTTAAKAEADVAEEPQPKKATPRRTTTKKAPTKAEKKPAASKPTKAEQAETKPDESVAPLNGNGATEDVEADERLFEPFLRYQRQAFNEAGKALESLIPVGFRSHSQTAFREMIEGYRTLFNAALDEIIETVEKARWEKEASDEETETPDTAK